MNLNSEGQAAEYLAVARIAAREIGSVHTGPSPASSQAIALYNRSSADLAATVPALIRKTNASSTLTLHDQWTGQTSELQIDSGKPGEYSPAYFQEILTARSVDRKGLTDDAKRPGLGGAVVGVQQGSPPPRLQPLKGFRVPVTAAVDFAESNSAPGAELRLLDPNQMDTMTLEGKRYPLAADYSAADPTKIPVIFVHGLLSSTYVWRNVVNSLLSDPEIRRRYQF